MARRDPQDSREIAVQVNYQLAPAFVWRENDLLNHRTDKLSWLPSPLRSIKRRDDALHRFVESARHVRVNENRRFILCVFRQLQRTAMSLEVVDLVFHQSRIDAFLDRVHELRALAIHLRDLIADAVLGGALLAAKAVDRVGVFAAKNLARFGLHQPCAQSTEHDVLKLVLGNRQTVLAKTLIARA